MGAAPQGPRIVRVAEPAKQPVYYTKPGMHSHNVNRKKVQRTQSDNPFSGLRILLFILGLAGLGYYGYTFVDQYVYQSYQNWAFDREIAGHKNVGFADFIRERTPFGFLAGAPSQENPSAPAQGSTPGAPGQLPAPMEGAVLGRVEIARLNLAAMVRQGVDASVLKVAVGHVPSTALPGQPGNFAIAAHRDTLFRALKDIRLGDLVTFQSPAGNYTYKVVATTIVRPSDVRVLQPDGGGLIPRPQLVSSSGQPSRLLTMITCYPFYYVGSAPKRFIVEAELVSSTPQQAKPASEMSSASRQPAAAG